MNPSRAYPVPFLAYLLLSSVITFGLTRLAEQHFQLAPAPGKPLCHADGRGSALCTSGPEAAYPDYNRQAGPGMPHPPRIASLRHKEGKPE